MRDNGTTLKGDKASYTMNDGLTQIAAFTATGEIMKHSNRLILSAVLGFATVVLPLKAKAATDDDKKFLAMASQSDQNEIALAKLAEDKTTNPSVKAFAQKMITEHTKMSASMKPFAESWGLTPPTGPDADTQK